MRRLALSITLLSVFGLAHAAGYSGSWTAHFTGADHGSCAIRIRPNGTLAGTCRGVDESKPFPVAGVVKGSHISFGVAGTGAEFAGSIGDTSGSGVWVNHGQGGKWTITRK